MPQIGFSAPVQERLSDCRTMIHWCGKAISWQWYYNGVQERPLFWDAVTGAGLIRCPQCGNVLTAP